MLSVTGKRVLVAKNQWGRHFLTASFALVSVYGAGVHQGLES